MTTQRKRKASTLLSEDPRPTKKIKCDTCEKKVQFVPKTTWHVDFSSAAQLPVLPIECWQQILFLIADSKGGKFGFIGGNGWHPSPACWHLALVCKEFYFSLAQRYVFPERVNDYWALHGDIKMTEFVMDAHTWGSGFQPTPQAAVLNFGVNQGHVAFVKYFLSKKYVPGPKIYYNAIISAKEGDKGEIMTALCRAFLKGQHDPRIKLAHLKELAKENKSKNCASKVLDVFCNAIKTI